ncbi:MAG: ISAs1 family transposase, partial [Bacteroidota bacterium]
FKNEKQKASFQTRFYISSKEDNATYFGICTRNHWSIENQLHWYLDVVFNEDRQRVRKDNAPDNMATTRKMALQLLLGLKGKDSLKKVRKRAAWNEKFLIKVLSTIPERI